MSIFGNRRVNTQTETVAAFEGYVDESLAGLQTILAESSLQSYQLRAGMYVSDILMEEAVLEGAATPEILMEGLVKDSFGKIREMFQKLWAKIKAWFEKAKKGLQLMFSSGQAFIKKFKEDIRSKSSKGFSYNGYKYTLNAGHGAVTGKIDTLLKAIGESVDFDISEAQMSTSGQEKSLGDSSGKHKDSFNLSDEKEELLKQLGGDDLSEVLKTLAQEFRDGKDSKEDFEDFGGNSKEELIKMVEDASTAIRAVENAQKTTDTQFGRVLGSINKAKSKIEGTKTNDEAGAQNKGRLVTFATHKYNMAHYALTLMASLNGVEVEALKEAAKQAESVLKSFLRFKPAKEGFGGEDDTHESILESSMKFI